MHTRPFHHRHNRQQPSIGRRLAIDCQLPSAAVLTLLGPRKNAFREETVYAQGHGLGCVCRLTAFWRLAQGQG